MSSRRPISKVRWLISTLILLPVAVIWAFFLGGHWQSFRVISASMEPTLMVGDCVIMRQQKHYPTLDDMIVVLRDPIGGSIPIVKRVVAGANSIVDLRNGRVYLDKSKTAIPGEPLYNRKNKSWILTEDELFVMGDNRNNSEDSTHFGPVKRSDVLGVITWRYWPFARMGNADTKL